MRKIFYQMVFFLFLFTACTPAPSPQPTVTATLSLSKFEPIQTPTLTPSPEPTSAYGVVNPMGLLIPGFDQGCIGLPPEYLDNYPFPNLEECDFSIGLYRLYRVAIDNPPPFEFITEPDYFLNYHYDTDRNIDLQSFPGGGNTSEISIFYFSSIDDLQEAFSTMKEEFIPDEVSVFPGELTGSQTIVGPLQETLIGEQSALGYKVTWSDLVKRRDHIKQVDILFTRCGNLIFINDYGEVYLEDDEIKINYSAAVYYANNLDDYLSQFCQE